MRKPRDPVNLSSGRVLPETFQCRHDTEPDRAVIRGVGGGDAVQLVEQVFLLGGRERQASGVNAVRG